MKLPITPRLAWVCRATGHRFFYSSQYRRELRPSAMMPPASLSFEVLKKNGKDRIRMTRHACCDSQSWVRRPKRKRRLFETFASFRDASG